MWMKKATVTLVIYIFGDSEIIGYKLKAAFGNVDIG